MNVRKIARLFGFFSIVFFLSALGVLALPAWTAKSSAAQPHYQLTFLDELLTRIHVRTSFDGQNFKDEVFPAAATSKGSPVLGVGAEENRDAFLSVLWGRPFVLNYELGEIGLWPARATEITWKPPSASTFSSTLVKNAPGATEMYLAFNLGNKVSVKKMVFNSAEFAPTHNLNQGLVGRPAITSLNEKIVVAWRRDGGGSGGFQLVTMLGEMQISGPRFGAPVLVSLPSSVDGISVLEGITSDPDVTHDNSKFYVSMVREDRGGGAGTLHGWRTIIMQSSDGRTWSHLTQTKTLKVVNKSIVNIASGADGEIVAISVTGKTRFTEEHAAIFKSGVWQSLSNSTVFLGARPAPTQFALVRLKGKPKDVVVIKNGPNCCRGVRSNSNRLIRTRVDDEGEPK